MSPVVLSKAQGRRLWLFAQGLDRSEPFGSGADATPRAVDHLGYVQIDTINVIERCHHHILFTRIPSYRREHLMHAQSANKSVFEYWTHALAYLPTQHFRMYLPDMLQHRRNPRTWFGSASKADLRKVLSLIEDGGPISIRDIEDDVLVEKDHPWASRKPSKRALQLAFYSGLLTISERRGMLKTYELTGRHFGWETLPRAATERQIAEYLLDRALRSQAVISIHSAAYGNNGRKAALRELIEKRVARRRLVPVAFEGGDRIEHWTTPKTLDQLGSAPQAGSESLVHILSPFDPLVIQRKRLAFLFGYEHRFEAYVPKDKRVLGYFALPVLLGDRVVAALDLKTDRKAGILQVQKWTPITEDSPETRHTIEKALSRFERFQIPGEHQNEKGAPEGAQSSTGTDVPLS